MVREAVQCNGVAAEWVSVPESRPDRTLLYLHGGSFAFRFPNTHAAFAARMCRLLGARALVPDYRLAPDFAARLVGLGLLGASVVKVFLFDLAFLDTPFRIAAFGGLGVALMGISWLYGRYGADVDAQTAQVTSGDPEAPPETP